MKRSGEIGEKPDFWSKFDLLTWFPRDQEFFWKKAKCQFWPLMGILLHAKNQKKLMSGSGEKALRTDGRTDARTHGTKFIGPSSAKAEGPKTRFSVQFWTFDLSTPQTRIFGSMLLIQ